MKGEASPGMQMFVAAGLFILAWRMLPAEDWHPVSKIMAGLPALIGAILLIGAVGRSVRRAMPWWQGLIGRALVVTIAWGLIVATAATHGTPHLVYKYSLNGPQSVCFYLGWKGPIEITNAISPGDSCPIVYMVR